MTLVLTLVSLAQDSRIACRSRKFFMADKTTTNKIRSSLSVALLVEEEEALEEDLHMEEEGQIRVVSSLGLNRILASRLWLAGQTKAMAAIKSGKSVFVSQGQIQKRIEFDFYSVYICFEKIVKLCFTFNLHVDQILFDGFFVNFF